MAGGQGTSRVDRIWQGAIVASCLVHFCLVVGGLLLISSPVRLPFQSPAIQVALIAPQEEIRTTTAAEKVATPVIPSAPPAVVERPALIPQPQPVVPAPIKSPVPAPKPLVKPVSPPVVRPEVKPLHKIVLAKQPVINSELEPRQLEHNPANLVTAPVVAATNAPTEIAKPESILVTEPEGVSAAEQVAVRERYLAQLRQQIERYKKYPLMARKGRQQGVVVVEFELSLGGDLQSVLLRESCGKRLLDQAALAAVKAAAPFPAIPPQLQLAEARYAVPLRFVLEP